MATLRSPTENTTPERSETVADLAHGLSAALGGLLAMGELLQRQPLTETAQLQVRTMLDIAQRMARTLQDAADIDGLDMPPKLEPASLRQVIDEAEAFWRSKTKCRGPQVLISCNAPSDLKVMVDPSRLRRLLDALIEDRFDTNGSGVIELQLATRLEPDGAVILSGRLEAPGASTRLDGSAALELCRLLARQMGGAIATARADGAGALTTVELCLKKADHKVTDPVDTAGGDGPLPARTHLLIVDDNATNRIVAAALCDMFGCTSETAEDGVEAVEAARSRPFDLILMDIKMPRMDGLDATKAIRALPGAAAKTPIVALTANADADAAASYIAGGMQAVVDKPIKPDQLLSTLQWVLGMQADAVMSQSSAA